MKPQARTLQLLDNQFRAALAFAYAFVIARLFGLVLAGQDFSVGAVVATYLVLGAAAVGLRRAMTESTDARAARMMTYVTLGAIAATAPEFW